MTAYHYTGVNNKEIQDFAQEWQKYLKAPNKNALTYFHTVLHVVVRFFCLFEAVLASSRFLGFPLCDKAAIPNWDRPIRVERNYTA